MYAWAILYMCFNCLYMYFRAVFFSVQNFHVNIWGTLNFVDQLFHEIKNQNIASRGIKNGGTAYV